LASPPTKFAEYVEIVIQRPLCPRCHDDRIAAPQRSADNGDGTRTRWVHCEACLYRFKLIVSYEQVRSE
jgi:DNA-directed RNA polymerase subunit M/transcription elongation factor TFIIS